MPDNQGEYCPEGFRFVPDSQGYTCLGGHHRLNRAGESPPQEAERRRRERERERQQRIQDEKKRKEEKQRERTREKEREKQREVDDAKAKTKARAEQEQKADFEIQRREALARARNTLNAPLGTASTESRAEMRIQEDVAASPVHEMDENPFAYPWLQNLATPVASQREWEPVLARRPRREETEKKPWEQ
jgi:hypothetical protein